VTHFPDQIMRVLVTGLVCLTLSLVALATPASARSIDDIPGAREALLRIVSPKFYRTLLISPVSGWIVARGQLAGTGLASPRIVHSELGGTYDSLAVELANNLQILGYPRMESGQPNPSVLVHVLVYQIRDGKLALSFANLDGAGGNQLRYYGAAWMAVEKPNHLWVTIEPLRLASYEKRGPHMFTLGVELPTAKINLPRAMSRRGGEVRALRFNAR
jgi:hypothetical protein